MALFVGWFVGVVGWGVRVEKLIAKGTLRHEELAESKEELARDVKELTGRQQSQGDAIIEIKTDLRYIREGVDELKKRNRIVR